MSAVWQLYGPPSQRTVSMWLSGACPRTLHLEFTSVCRGGCLYAMESGLSLSGVRTGPSTSSTRVPAEKHAAGCYLTESILHV
jgi:hypothetical protein